MSVASTESEYGMYLWEHDQVLVRATVGVFSVPTLCLLIRNTLYGKESSS